MIIYLCIKYESNTLFYFQKLSNGNQFSRTDVRTDSGDTKRKAYNIGRNANVILMRDLVQYTVYRIYSKYSFTLSPYHWITTGTSVLTYLDWLQSPMTKYLFLIILFNNPLKWNQK